MEPFNRTIEQLMLRFKPLMGTDYVKYRNHIYRVFLNCLLMDKQDENIEKYAVAAVFHDIGIWTDNTIDYLDPSIKQVEKYLDESCRGDWVEEISRMINWHHKVSRYEGDYSKTVETFRKADWMDVSFGIMAFGVSRKKIRESRINLQNEGFHFFLIKKIALNFLQHPLNPLPMFKK
ncbi:HD domain-containing protein [Pedobacter sp. HMF7647]|uniref:HD domain-containing protein n=1 Tax=Hufsiella arboris TaxID=2695275 RepID=A0A7K1Y7P6_9SPHI|nr:HD domain-containing protein [Hufsiella arboris]MXV50602.1 HD domain-containing protein [Hufsiella arboris]